MRALARDLQAKATAVPLTDAGPTIALQYFAQVDRELKWGLTLNK